jgi:hypothetical protein
VSYPEQYGGASREELSYTLEADGSHCVVHCDFINGVFEYSLIGWREGSPIYASLQPANPIDTAKSIVERYQAYVGSARYVSLLSMIDTVSQAKAERKQSGATIIDVRTVSEGSFKLEYAVNNQRSTSFVWRYCVDDAETIILSIKLNDGKLYSISDKTNIFTVSDATVTVSSEQAISIAIANALNYSWVTKGTSSSVDAIPEKLARTQLFLTSRLPREPFVFYPFWRVDLWLGETVGGVSHVAVGIWADTGEVCYVKGLGGGGESPGEEAIAPSTLTPSSSQSSTSTPSYSQPNDARLPAKQPEDDSTTTDTPQPTAETSAHPPSLPQVLAVTATVIAAIALAGTSLYLKKKR